MSERVVVAMSGGVDSSVAAALLKKDGYDVTGVTMRVADCMENGLSTESTDVEDARKVAEIIGIPHLVVDLRDTFHDEIVLPFVRAYARGMTPNPCITCNRKIKFGVLMQKAVEMGAAGIATGHHARIIEHEGIKMIARGRDNDKDQSYFLFQLTHRDLGSIMFPVGEIRKEEVRRIAGQLDLPVARKKDSLEICFIPDDDYITVVEKYSRFTPPAGEIVTADGKMVGEHGGIHRFTVGQRRGLNVALGKPMYVLELDGLNNRVLIGSKDECRSRGLVANGVVWNYYKPFEKKMKISVKIRYQAQPVEARLFPIDDDGVEVVFDRDGPLVTPGQAVVFYKDDLVLGGGWITGKSS